MRLQKERGLIRKLRSRLHTPERRFKAEKAAVSVLFIAFFAATYFSTERINALRPLTHYVSLESWWDTLVPLTPAFIYFYFLYYIWAPLPAFIAKDRRSFYHTILTYFVLQLSAALTFLVVPAHIPRVSLAPQTFTENLLAGIYLADPGVNLLPSLHVGHSLLTALFFYAQKHPLRHFIGVGSFFISISTVLVKQHYVIDIPFGVLYALSAFYVGEYAVKKLEMHVERFAKDWTFED